MTPKDWCKKHKGHPVCDCPSDAVDWLDCYPVVDVAGRLTGEVCELGKNASRFLLIRVAGSTLVQDQSNPDAAILDTFAARLRTIRDAKGITVTDLAESAGLSRQTIYNYENGVGEPTWAVVCKLAECLGVSTEVFRGQ